MANKTHLTSQEENVAESGVQMRTTEPSVPVESQIWIRTDQRRIKCFTGGQTVVLAKGFTPSVEVTTLALDAALSDTFWKNIVANSIFTISNLLDGYTVSLMIYNTSAAQVEVSISNQTKWANGHNGLLAANTRKIFTFTRVNDNTVISAIAYPA